eukprot:346799-Chlamydomonas_euryale.AAC.1
MPHRQQLIVPQRHDVWVVDRRRKGGLHERGVAPNSVALGEEQHLRRQRGGGPRGEKEHPAGECVFVGGKEIKGQGFAVPRRPHPALIAKQQKT